MGTECKFVSLLPYKISTKSARQHNTDQLQHYANKASFHYHPI